MGSIFSPRFAVKLNLWAAFLVLAMLLTVPVRSTVVIALLFLYSVVYWVKNRSAIKLDGYDYIVFACLSGYMISNVPAFIMEDFRFRYFGGPINMVMCIPIYVVAKHSIRTEDVPRFRDYMEWGLIIGSAGALVLAMYQTQWLGMRRADGFLFSINFGYLASALTFLSLTMVRGSKRKGLLLFASLFGAVAVLLTLTRGAIFALPLLFFLSLFMNLKKIGVTKVLALFSVFIIGSGLVYTLSSSVQNRMKYTVEEVIHIVSGDVEDATSSGARLYMWLAAYEAFRERPLIGLTYTEREALNRELYEQGRNIHEVAVSSRGHAHSQYFENLATGGLIGILAVFGYLLLPGIYHIRCYYRDRTNHYSMVAAVFCAGFALYCLTEVALQQEMINAFYAYLNVLLLIFSLRHQQDKESSVREVAYA
ncbi:O-antigen ligase family protein [Halomonas alkalisoli]|uniref:O-antigen ligase family protein n=1 Tax=Halomonas alkalisoli TaxID=2907158 RepID=UPI001F2B85C5|nr:O-antigen ligase family protein [Halomonas alkalisoli]MCE9684324.1 O-antigen ligase family protein [Halomonas alkalisoli]